MAVLVTELATASGFPFYDNFVRHEVPLWKISYDAIAYDLWFGLPAQSKFLATPKSNSIIINQQQTMYGKTKITKTIDVLLPASCEVE